MTEVDWPALHRAALQAQSCAYAPYSRFMVGAAALTQDGQIFTGCNTENASYGVGLCAECGLISALTLGGGGKLRAFLCYGNYPSEPPRLTVPCGRCRQLLAEHAGENFQIEIPDNGVVNFDAILPYAFGPRSLDFAVGEATTATQSSPDTLSGDWEQ